MSPDPFAEPERKPYRLIRTSEFPYEAVAVKTEAVLVDKATAYRVAFGYAAAQARNIIGSPPQTHAELDSYRALIEPVPSTPEGFRERFEDLNGVFQTFHRQLFLVVRPGESIV